MKKYEINTEESEFHFKEEFYYISKIFVYLSKILDLDQLIKIKEDICQILYEKNIINEKKFGILIPLFFIFNQDKYEDIDMDNNIRMISQKFKFNTSIYNREKYNKEEEIKINDNPSLDNSDSKPESEQKVLLEIKKELLAKFLVKEKDIALRARRLARSESKTKIELMSSKKRQRRKGRKRRN